MSADSATTQVSLDNISKFFAGADGARISAIVGLSVSFREGEWTYVLGANGSGKSTLLRLLAGELCPDEGDLKFPPELLRHRRYVEQGVLRNLVPSMTILENMLLKVRSGTQLLPSLRRTHSEEEISSFREALALFGMGLEKRLGDKVGHLSGGQQQAVVAAKVLAGKPRLLLLDEFTSALDHRTSKKVLDVVSHYAKTNGLTVLSVTHDLHQVEGRGDRLLVLDAGGIKADIVLAGSQLSAKQIAEVVYG